jgi:hypothetical protein
VLVVLPLGILVIVLVILIALGFIRSFRPATGMPASRPG